MAKLSSWRAGGRARRLFTPANQQALAELADHSQTDIVFVGYGSNLLVRDGGFDGIIVRTSPGLVQLRQDSATRVYAEAGVGCPKLARYCAKRGFAGSEFWAGIPGTVGGALAMNAGCHGGETWQHVASVVVYNSTGFATRTRAGFTVRYREVARDANTQFAAACFDFKLGEPKELMANIRQLLRVRSETQPLGESNAGSVFKNPPGGFAGRLIDQCGLKGMRIGDAQVSQKHANFIINTGAARAADIEELITTVQQTVAERTGVCLQPEVQIIGTAA